MQEAFASAVAGGATLYPPASLPSPLYPPAHASYHSSTTGMQGAFINAAAGGVPYSSNNEMQGAFINAVAEGLPYSSGDSPMARNMPDWKLAARSFSPVPSPIVESPPSTAAHSPKPQQTQLMLTDPLAGVPDRLGRVRTVPAYSV